MHRNLPPTLVFMDLPQTIVLDVANLLTLAGVVVAILAAIYSGRAAHAAQLQAAAADETLKEAKAQSDLARASLLEAKRQNHIAGHAHRLDAYRSLLSFRGQVTSSGVEFQREAIWSLWEHVEVAEFYFSEAVAKSLNEIVSLALALHASRDEWKGDSGFGEGDRKAKVERTYAQLKQLRGEVDGTDKLMRKELRLVENED